MYLLLSIKARDPHLLLFLCTRYSVVVGLGLSSWRNWEPHALVVHPTSCQIEYDWLLAQVLVFGSMAANRGSMHDYGLRRFPATSLKPLRELRSSKVLYR